MCSGTIPRLDADPRAPAPSSRDAAAQLTDGEGGPEEGALHAIRRGRNRERRGASRDSAVAHLAAPCP